MIRSSVTACRTIFFNPTLFPFFINAVKNLQNNTNTKTLHKDNAGNMEMHSNPAIAAYKNSNI